MNDDDKTRDQLIKELMQMRVKIADLENSRSRTQQSQGNERCQQTENSAEYRRTEEALRKSEAILKEAERIALFSVC
jgi:hypothetical protein